MKIQKAIGVGLSHHSFSMEVWYKLDVPDTLTYDLHYLDSEKAANSFIIRARDWGVVQSYGKLNIMLRQHIIKLEIYSEEEALLFSTVLPPHENLRKARDSTRYFLLRAPMPIGPNSGKF